MDLSVDVGAVRLANPVIAASGTFGYGIEFAHLTDLNRLGGIVVKGLSLEPMEGAPPPRLVPNAAGMLNAVGLQNIGVRGFIAEKLPALRAYRTQIIANVFGHTIEEYVGVIGHLEAAEGLAAYELNISCPNVACGGMQFGSSPQMVAEVVSAARRAARRPLWVKLSPNVTDIGLIARAAAEAGADALTVANTYPAMSVDFRSRKSRLGNPTRGTIRPSHPADHHQAGLRGLQGRQNPRDCVWAESRRPRTFSSISWSAPRRSRWARPILPIPGPARRL